MASPNKNARERKSYAFPKEHVAITATGSVKLFKARKRTRIDRIDYINVTGLAEDPANAFKVEAKNGATVVATIANTDSDLDPDVGASIPANTPITASLGSLANRTLAADDVLDITFTETETATLPAGTVIIWFTELN